METARRSLLSALGTGSVTLAGCLSSARSDSDGPSGLALGRIELQNRSPKPVDARLTIEKDGERLYRETLSFDAATYESDPPRTPMETVVEEWFGTTAEYDVSVAIPDENLDATASTANLTEAFDAENGVDGTCFAFFVTIGSWRKRELDAVRIGPEVVPFDDILPYADACHPDGDGTE